MKGWLALALLSLALEGGGGSQAGVRFSSVYTDLNRQCRAGPERGPDGADVPTLCSGVGGYSLRLIYRSSTALLSAERGAKKIPLAEVEFDYDEQKGQRVEWRMAGGVPFAVIVRVNVYRPAPEGEREPIQSRYRTGTVLRVVGLEGSGHLRAQLSARLSNAQARARAIADAGYRRR